MGKFRDEIHIVGGANDRGIELPINGDQDVPDTMEASVSAKTYKRILICNIIGFKRYQKVSFDTNL